MKKTKPIDYITEIEKLKRKKNAIILAHYYQTGDIQDIADFVGDSLALSQKAASNDADIILFAGVKFMAETAKILSPGKKVLLPDVEAGCSLADSCTAEEFTKFINENPGRTIISYVNTTAEIKALSDIICTSSNAVQIVNSFPEKEKFIFAPDRNLGNYVKNLTGRDIVVFNGACHVHEEFSIENILKLKEENPEAKIIVHPECELPVRMIADYIGSTSGLLSFIKKDEGNCYIVATEPGIIHQMKKANPDKIYIPAPPKDSTCGCKECNFMKLITVEKIYNCLKNENPEIILDEKTMENARKPIMKMMQISEKPGL
ncbi:MAG TPA: quinolinate synthase NadA [Bacteroidales bacterium]|jgi:quinolinate synthase|nr:quinolinate synthase NadA [Bacteroidales bacterium]OQB64630.1 MAG: Quinolinate synthase A [Bacteroidetes bacterium ADurb.Bin145]HOU00915.1 quinolinate synthase NadA [Bacteroidales bacterium]HQK66694.1 quinolinate synthase NadA [Bacteroidales bacterium]